MTEASILSAVRIGLSKAGAVVFRNNSGRLIAQDGRAVSFGVGPMRGGGSDLIGYRSVLVTPEMVGTRVAVFLACEVKTPEGRATTAQRHFLETVQTAGGIAILARSDAEAVRALEAGLSSAAK